MQSHMSSTPSAAAKKKVSQPGRSKVKDVKALVNVWKELLRTAQLTDVTFVVGPKQKEFRCHRLVFASWSAEFRRLFEDVGSGSSERVSLPKVASSTFKVARNFMYTGTLEYQHSHLVELIDFSRLYRIESLSALCVRCFHEHLTLAAAWQLLSQTFCFGASLRDLHDLVMAFCERHFVELMKRLQDAANHSGVSSAAPSSAAPLSSSQTPLSHQSSASSFARKEEPSVLAVSAAATAAAAASSSSSAQPVETSSTLPSVSARTETTSPRSATVSAHTSHLSHSHSHSHPHAEELHHFALLPTDVIRNFLSTNRMELPEDFLFQFLLFWTKQQAPERRQALLGELLPLLRLFKLSLRLIYEKMKSEPLLGPQSDAARLLKEEFRKRTASRELTREEMQAIKAVEDRQSEQQQTTKDAGAAAASSTSVSESSHQPQRRTVSDDDPSESSADDYEETRTGRFFVF